MEGLNIDPSMVARLVEYADGVPGPVVEGDATTETEDPGEAEPGDSKSELIVVGDETLGIGIVSDNVCEFGLAIAEVVTGK